MLICSNQIQPDNLHLLADMMQYWGFHTLQISRTGVLRELEDNYVESFATWLRNIHRVGVYCLLLIYWWYSPATCLNLKLLESGPDLNGENYRGQDSRWTDPDRTHNTSTRLPLLRVSDLDFQVIIPAQTGLSSRRLFLRFYDSLWDGWFKAEEDDLQSMIIKKRLRNKSYSGDRNTENLQLRSTEGYFVKRSWLEDGVVREELDKTDKSVDKFLQAVINDRHGY